MKEKFKNGLNLSRNYANKMKIKKIIKIIMDMAMLILLPLLMAYSLIGETAHEWLGISIFLLFILHHIMNPAWLKTLFKGRYSPYRIYLTMINVLLLVIMVILPVSRIIMSKHIFRFSDISGMAIMRTVHLLISYWGFILMSVHVGNHIGIHQAKKKAVTVLLWAVAIAVSVYGIYTFAKRDISSYLFLKNQFVFFDFGQTRIYFFADYISMICLFACVGAIISKFLKIFDKWQMGNRKVK